MNTTDPIADMLTRIRNANSSKHKTVDIPASNMKLGIAEILYKEGYIFKKYQKNGDEKAHFETANPKRCNTFWPKNYCLLYNREETEKLFQQMQKQGDALTAIEFTCDGNPAAYSVRIYPEGIKIGWREYVDYIFLWLEKNVNGYTELCSRKKSLILQIDKLNKKLERKAKEPVGFWETIIGAFADMFR